jgi:hypothetical protein
LPHLRQRTTNVQFFPALRALCLVLVLLAPLAGVAGPAMYTGEAPVTSQSDDERAAALKTALANVVIERTGDSGVLARAEVARAVGEAERYVLTYQYRRGSGADASAPLVLVAQFDGAAVDRMLRQLGLLGGEAAATPAEAPSEATVRIDGIHGADDYARVMRYLGSSNFVRNAQPLHAQGDSLVLRLSLSTSLARFLDAVGLERTLAVADAGTHGDGIDATLALGQ